MRKFATSLTLIAPSIWFGMIIALSFLEAPLKFQAPGITTALGLGIGRLVFVAANISAYVLLITLTLAGAVAKLTAGRWVTIGLLWLVLSAQVFIVRPPLNARSDQIIAGIDPGHSLLHLVYIAADVLVLVLIATFLIQQSKRVIRLDVANFN